MRRGGVCVNVEEKNFEPGGGQVSGGEGMWEEGVFPVVI